MPILFIPFLFLFQIRTTMPDSQDHFIPGEYALRGVHDMAAGFLFTPDGKFQFGYAYGAVDRMAEGTYSVSGDTIKLKSRKEPGKDFSILRQEKRGRQIIIQVQDPNQYLKSTVVAFYGSPEHFEVAEADKDGRIVIPEADPKQVYLRHQLYVDIPTLIRDEGDDNTFFEVSMNPSLAEVSFQGIDLFIKEGDLTCHPNYFMPFEHIRFVRME